MKKLLLISLLIIGCNNTNTNTNQSEELTLSSEEYLQIGDSLYTELGIKGGGKYAPAIREYTKAIKVNPHNYEAYLNRGYAKFMVDDIKGAEQDWTELINIHSNEYEEFGDNNYLKEAYIERGILRDKLDNLKGACEDWKKAANLGDTEAAEYYDEDCY